MTSQQIGQTIESNYDGPESRLTAVSPTTPTYYVPSDSKRGKGFANFSTSDLVGALGHKKSNVLFKPKKNTQKHQPSNKAATESSASLRELSPDDVVIAVMGPTGSGKSTFINTVVENSTIAVGYGLHSCTSDISTVRLSFPELIPGDIVFVDTPGFDHSHKTETDVLKMVADWLKATYEKDILLSGLVYCHRISNTQMAATSMRHLRTFEKLCGQDALQKVVLVTTMWDEVEETVGNLEEERMKTRYWNEMLEHNSTTGRFMGTRESALQLLRPLIDAANNKRISLLLQQEMVDMKKKLTMTSAGRHLFNKAQHIVTKRQDLLQKFQAEMKRPVDDRTSLQPLHEELRKLNQSLASIVEEMRMLILPVALRLLETSERWLHQKLSVLRLMVVEPAKVDEVVDRMEGEASPASGSKGLSKELPKLPSEVSA